MKETIYMIIRRRERKGRKGFLGFILTSFSLRSLRLCGKRYLNEAR
jgi:hypothetical protein